MATKVLSIRLPEDHWIWKLPSRKRQVLVRQALENCRMLEKIMQTTEEIKDEIQRLKIVDQISEHSKDREPLSTRKRLKNSLSSWLED